MPKKNNLTKNDFAKKKTALSNVDLDRKFNEKSIFNFSANSNEHYEKKNSLSSRYNHLLRKRRRGNQNEIIPVDRNRQFDFNFSNYYENAQFKEKEKWWTNPDLPQLIHGYFLLFFSVLIFSILGFAILQLVLTIRRDLKNKAARHSSEILQQILECSNQYQINHCDPKERVPAMQKICSEWELCMNRRPDDIIMSEVVGETIAETLNQFIKPLEVKTVVIFVILIVGVLVASNVCFLVFKHFNRGKKNYNSRHKQKFIPSIQMTSDEYIKYKFLTDS
ncbi:hypothetical protein BCR36DRAFT_361516 [Piromyces finnis]|uniref:Brl1/Brr6 domain-containing protein n=1 Tax=Piromyces finnis TaxID=1754191 RepID=A0A1Y1V053_9FUNG|nr:hypothetical protein BCR36DRAFT_361516 [Piromyces finnis]|eukprot:ORX43147.1 hypothetical protein BCR36DRAFT_361516 [Piromyces finnis]